MFHSFSTNSDDTNSQAGATAGNASTIKRGGGNAVLQHAVTVSRGGRGGAKKKGGKEGVKASNVLIDSQIEHSNSASPRRKKADTSKQDKAAALKRRIQLISDDEGEGIRYADNRNSIIGLSSPRGGAAQQNSQQFEQSESSSSYRREKLVPLPASILQRQSALYKELGIPYDDYITRLYTTETEAADESTWESYSASATSTARGPMDGSSSHRQSPRRHMDRHEIAIHKRLWLIARAFASAATVAPKSSAQLRDEELLRKMFGEAAEALRSELVGVLGEKHTDGRRSTAPLNQSTKSNQGKDGIPPVSTKTVVASRISKRLLSDPVMHAAFSKVKKERKEEAEGAYTTSGGVMAPPAAKVRLAPISPERQAPTRNSHSSTNVTHRDKDEYVSTLPPIAAAVANGARVAPYSTTSTAQISGPAEDKPKVGPVVIAPLSLPSPKRSGVEEGAPTPHIEVGELVGQSALSENQPAKKAATRHPALILFDVQELVEAEQRRVLREYKALANRLNGRMTSISPTTSPTKNKGNIRGNSDPLPAHAQLPHLLSDYFHLHLDFTKLRRQTVLAPSAESPLNGSIPSGLCSSPPVVLTPVELIYIIHYLTTLQSSQGSLNHVKRLVGGLGRKAHQASSSDEEASAAATYSYLSSCHDFDDCGGEDIVSVLQSINSIGSINLSNLSVVSEGAPVDGESGAMATLASSIGKEEEYQYLDNPLRLSQGQGKKVHNLTSVQELNDRKHLAANYRRVAERVAKGLLVDKLLRRCSTVVDIQLPQSCEELPPTPVSETKGATRKKSLSQGQQSTVSSKVTETAADVEANAHPLPISDAAMMQIRSVLGQNLRRQGKIERLRGGRLSKPKKGKADPTPEAQPLPTKAAESLPTTRHPSASSSASMGIHNPARRRSSGSTSPATAALPPPPPHPLALGGSIQRTLHGARRPNNHFATTKQLNGDSRPQTAEDTFMGVAQPRPSQITAMTLQAPDIDFFIWENSSRLAIIELEGQSMAGLLWSEHSERLATAKGVQTAFTARRNVKERREFERIAFQEMLIPHIYVKEARQFKRLLIEMLTEEETIGRAGIHRSLRRMEEQLRRENREALVVIKRRQRARDETAKAEKEFLAAQVAARQQSQNSFRK